jgi:hypothetical protein
MTDVSYQFEIDLDEAKHVVLLLNGVYGKTSCRVWGYKIQ